MPRTIVQGENTIIKPYDIANISDNWQKNLPYCKFFLLVLVILQVLMLVMLLKLTKTILEASCK